MRLGQIARIAGFAGLFWNIAVPGWAQIAEITGSRALGMAGAFVAVASDSSATWWNPAGLAAGPFLDVAMATNRVETSQELPAWRHKIASLAIGTPPIGFGYYRFRITDIRPFDPTGSSAADREDRRAVPVRSLSASQVGVTLVRTLIPGVHAGTTVKYVRGTLRQTRGDPATAPSELLRLGESLDSGNSEGRFDLDIGVLVVTGPLRLGARMRNVLEPQFESATSESVGNGMLQLPREFRVGAAFDPEAATGVPLVVALDVDAVRYESVSGVRRVVALGGEQWLFDKRLGIRAGARANTVGARGKAATAGVSVAVRPGLYLDGHAVRGGSDEEAGWGLAARVSF